MDIDQVYDDLKKGTRAVTAFAHRVPTTGRAWS
jgi:hypothetical protein